MAPQMMSAVSRSLDRFGRGLDVHVLFRIYNIYTTSIYTYVARQGGGASTKPPSILARRLLMERVWEWGSFT